MEITITFGIVTAVIVGLAEAAKRLGVPPRWIPLLDIALGVGGAFLYAALDARTPQPWPYTVFLGLIMGLTACGLYSGGKNLISTAEPENED